MKTKILGAAALASLLCLPMPSQAGIDPYLGEIMTFAGNFCPTGWLPANGQVLPLNQNTALFSILGTMYGGDGVTTFALPYVKPILTVSRAPLMSCIATVGVFPSRN
jgi:microcystin-dependent protein